MITFEEYRKLDATDLAKAILRGDLKPSEVLEAAIVRAEAINPKINAIVHMQYDQARDVVAKGILPNRPFSGVPYLLKDLGAFDKGQPCNMGSRFWTGFTPGHDATYTERCKAAGVLIMGRTNTPELGLNASTEPVVHGATLNPWNFSKSVGGSSGGSAAAVAGGILPMAHATDGGGSIRIPAANCGLFGMKPTRGRNPSGPDAGEGWSGLSTGHVVSRSVRDSARMLDCTHGPALGDPYAAPLPTRPFEDEVRKKPGELKIALMTDGFDGRPLDAECVAGINEAAKLCIDLGHQVEPAQPNLDIAALLRATRTIISGNVWNVINLRCKSLGREPSSEDVEPVTRAFAEEGCRASAGDYAAAILILHQQGRVFSNFFKNYDVILSSTMRHPPLAIGSISMQTKDFDKYYKALLEDELAITPVYNQTGCPAMTVPLHWSADGLPIGIHFGATFGDEATLFRLASQLEEAKPWFNKRPNFDSKKLPT